MRGPDNEDPAVGSRNHFRIFISRVKANLFVNTGQGAIVIAPAGERLEHIGRVFRYLKEIVPLSC
jgi:hypothetical protein